MDTYKKRIYGSHSHAPEEVSFGTGRDESYYCVDPFDNNLPVRRINNHMPPPGSLERYGWSGHSRMLPETTQKYNIRGRDAESVMNFTMSESDDSEADDYSGSSEDHTTSSYATDGEEEVHDSNFSWMNEGLIQCHRVGPRATEVQLNIPLPSGYLKNLGKAGDTGGGSHKVLNCAPTQYNPMLVEDRVLEIDPYKQYRERIAPQFLASLIEGGGSSSDSDDSSSVDRQHDDSQIFGEFDAQRTAMQQAIYNQLVLQQDGCPDDDGSAQPSQDHIFVTVSSGTTATSNGASDNDAEIESTHIELSLDGSLEVFSRPQNHHQDELFPGDRSEIQEDVRKGKEKSTSELSLINDDIPSFAAEERVDDTYDQEEASIISLSPSAEDSEQHDKGEETKKCEEEEEEDGGKKLASIVKLGDKLNNKYREKIAKYRFSKSTAGQKESRNVADLHPNTMLEILHKSSEGNDEAGGIISQHLNKIAKVSANQDTTTILETEVSTHNNDFEMEDMMTMMVPTQRKPIREAILRQGDSNSKHGSVESMDMDGCPSFDGAGKLDIVDDYHCEARNIEEANLTAMKFASMVIPEFEVTPQRSLKPRRGAPLPVIEEQEWAELQEEDDRSKQFDENISQKITDSQRGQAPRFATFLQKDSIPGYEMHGKKEKEMDDQLDEPGIIIPGNLAPKSNLRHSTSPLAIESPNNNIPAVHSTAAVMQPSQGLSCRPILEETYKTNSRYDGSLHGTNQFPTEPSLSSRELRKNRLRAMGGNQAIEDSSFDTLDELSRATENLSIDGMASTCKRISPRASLKVRRTSSTVKNNDGDQTRDDDSSLRANREDDFSVCDRGFVDDARPDLDDLLDFHSCDEGYFENAYMAEAF